MNFIQSLIVILFMWLLYVGAVLFLTPIGWIAIALFLLVLK